MRKRCGNVVRNCLGRLYVCDKLSHFTSSAHSDTLSVAVYAEVGLTPCMSRLQLGHVFTHEIPVITLTLARLLLLVSSQILHAESQPFSLTFVHQIRTMCADGLEGRSPAVARLLRRSTVSHHVSSAG